MPIKNKKLPPALPPHAVPVSDEEMQQKRDRADFFKTKIASELRRFSRDWTRRQDAMKGGNTTAESGGNADLAKHALLNNVAVACSGGRDSMVLLDALRQTGVKPLAVHVNHGLRPTALRDQKTVENYCETHRLNCLVFDAPTNPLDGSEASARDYRYRCFEEALNGGKADYLLLAHHADDNAETLLLHLVRGCGVSGLAAMPEWRGRYGRPFLNVTRAEINAYAERFRVPYCDDESNADTKFARNFVRHEIMPMLSRLNPDAVAALNRTAVSARQCQDAIDATLPCCKLVRGETRIPTILAAHPAFDRILYLALKDHLPVDLEEKHLAAVKSLFCAPCGTSVDLPRNIRAVREADAVVLFLDGTTTTPVNRNQSLSDRDDVASPEPWRCPTQATVVAHGTVKLTPVADLTIPDAPILLVDPDKIPNGAVWRTRKSGDLFTPYGGGTRSLKEFLIDKKYPSRFRDNLPLLCYNNTVLIVVGLQIADAIQITKDSHRGVTIGAFRERN